MPYIANGYKGRFLAGATLGFLALMLTTPASAETEIEALKRELAEQKQLISKILAEQAARKPQEQSGAPAASPAASAAQTEKDTPTLTFYGLVDVGVEHITNISNTSSNTTGSLTRVPSITGTLPSRLGMNVNKEFLPGYKAIATLETGFNMDDGSLGQGGRIFGRQLFVGVDSPYGAMTIGRQNSMLLFGVGAADFIGPNIYSLGSLDAYLPNARFDNSIAWRKKFSKLSVGALYSTARDAKGGAPASGTCAGEIAGSANQCKGWSAMASYDDKSFSVAAAVDRLNGGTGATASFFNGAAPIAFSQSSDTDQRVAASGSIKFGGAKIGLGWLGRKVETSTASIKSNIYFLDAAYPITAKMLVDGGVYRAVNNDQDRSATLFLLRGLYSFDKNFTGYLQIGYIKNSDQAQYAVSVGPNIAPPAGGSQTAMMAGARYRF